MQKSCKIYKYFFFLTFDDRTDMTEIICIKRHTQKYEYEMHLPRDLAQRNRTRDVNLAQSCVH